MVNGIKNVMVLKCRQNHIDCNILVKIDEVAVVSMMMIIGLAKLLRQKLMI